MAKDKSAKAEPAEETDSDEMFANAHGVDLTAQVEKGGPGSIKVVRPSKDEPGKDTDADTMIDTDQDLRIVGEGFRDGEVVLNFDALNGQSMNTRISAQAVDGKFRATPPLFGWAGTWRITAYVPQEEAEGTESKRVMQMVDQATITVETHRI
jgi:hypothetical protein